VSAEEPDRECIGSAMLVADEDRRDGHLLREGTKNTQPEHHAHRAAVCPYCGQLVGTVIVSFKSGERRFKVHNTNTTFRVRSNRGLRNASGATS
jgi:hypothetical protein